MNKLLVNICYCFIPKKNNRHHFREKYGNRSNSNQCFDNKLINFFGGGEGKVHFIHAKNTANTGDLACGYYKYFCDLFKQYTLVIHDIKNIDFTIINKNDLVIIGGGGLFNDYFAEMINKVISINDNVVLFAIGYNFHYCSNDGKQLVYNSKDDVINLKKCKLVSIRDYQHPSKLRYIPCATCFIPQLTNIYEIKRKIGVVKHYHSYDAGGENGKLSFGQKVNSFEGFDSITNAYPIEEIIEFIGESEVIITNSYHICYFSMLMCKKVIFDAPFSDKFEYFRHKLIKYSGNLEKDIENSKIYPDFLNESRELVKNYLNDIKRIYIS
jgi:exopolysaccharide biosynthesis predicted pyruvyltransferase EpsI